MQDYEENQQNQTTQPDTDSAAGDNKKPWETEDEVTGFLAIPQPEATPEESPAQSPGQPVKTKTPPWQKLQKKFFPTKEASPDFEQMLPEETRTIRLNRVRQQKAARRRRFIVIATLILAVIFAALGGLFSNSVASAADMIDTMRIGMTPGGGFPVRTNIDEIYQLREMSGGFIELGSKDLLLYSASGSRLRSIQHGYARPAMCAGNTRFCLYGRGGNELRVESRSRNLYIKSTDEALLLCAMSQNGNLAVITRSPRYTAEVKVYNPNMEYRYGWSPSEKEGTPVSAAFSPDAKKLALCCMKASNGSLVSSIYVADTNSEELPLQCEEQAGMAIHLEWLDSSNLLAIYTDQAVVFNASRGEVRWHFDFEGKTLADYSSYGQRLALLFSDGASIGDSSVVVLNEKMKPVMEAEAHGECHYVTCTHTAVYLLKNTGILSYDMDGALLWELPTDTQPQAIVNAKNLLLFSGGQADVLHAPAQEQEQADLTDETEEPGEAEAEPDKETASLEPEETMEEDAPEDSPAEAESQTAE